MSNVVAIILVILAALGIGVGSFILAKKRKDRGLIIDADGDPLRWSKFHIPLLIVVRPDVAFWTLTFRYAIDLWNERTGIDLFVWGGISENEALGVEPGPGIIAIESAPDNGSAFHTRLTVAEDGEIRAAPIRVTGTPSDVNADRIATHELGHVLGLAHDDYRSSVMFPRAVSDSFEITDKDVETLQEWYA